MNQSFLEEWLTPELGQVKYKIILEYLMECLKMFVWDDSIMGQQFVVPGINW